MKNNKTVPFNFEKEWTPEVAQIFKIYCETYDPIHTSTRFWEMYLCFCKYVGMTSQPEMLPELAEDLIAIHRLHTMLDSHFLRTTLDAKEKGIGPKNRERKQEA